MNKNKIVVVIGPTASGKTKLSIELAKILNAEIINADAVQIYKDVNIGSAKITKSEMEGIPHHMIDFNPLSNKYTIYDYQLDARNILDKLIDENKNVVIVGGSGLYIKALLYNYDLKSETKEDITKYNDMSKQELKTLADEICENNNIHINNKKRLIRFITHNKNTNEIIKNTEYKDIPLYNFEIIALDAKRDELYEHINSRVDIMFNKGLLDEAKKLFDEGKNTDSIIGYKELNDFFRGNISIEEAKENIKKNSRHYAKRQYTWFKHQFENVKWVEVNYDDFDETIKNAIKELND